MGIVFFIGRVVLAGACLWSLFEYPNMQKGPEVIVNGLLGALVTTLWQTTVSAWDLIRIVPKLFWLAVSHRPLRISFAALIRIKIGDDLFLVKSRRSPHFQPVGGVYKFFDQDLRSKFGLEDDELKNPDIDELRLRFKAGQVWNVFRFLRWYNSRCGRESGPNREFREELINSGILSASEFEDVAFKYVRTETRHISFSKPLKVYELLSFEIFDAILSETQKAAIRALKTRPDDRYCFVTADQIEREGYLRGETVKLGTQTPYILS